VLETDLFPSPKLNDGGGNVLTKLIKRIKSLEIIQMEVMAKIDKLLKRLEDLEKEWETEHLPDIENLLLFKEGDDEEFQPDSAYSVESDGYSGEEH